MTPSHPRNTRRCSTPVNLSRFHREHEKFYASAPREHAVRLQRHARTLEALADTGGRGVSVEHRHSARSPAP